MTLRSRVLRASTERTWSWAPHKKERLQASFPPLRVIFCGSDSFSIPTFHMLREMHLRRSDIVSDLSVITPIDRPSGRGMKVLKRTPMSILADKMRYPVHHVRGFSLTVEELPPGTWDLIIAVSFGHKITADVLSGLSAGGLNIHPSLLPCYRGPAPLHHALLNQDEQTGVTLQTIHPTEFDRGALLMRSGLVPITNLSTLCSLSSVCSRLGASLLHDLLLNGYPTNAPMPLEHTEEPSYAPKLRKRDTRVEWSLWTSGKLVLWSNVLGSVWSEVDGAIIKLANLSKASNVSFDQTARAGTLYHHQNELFVKCIDACVRIGTLTLAGKSERRGSDMPHLHHKLLC